MHYTPHAIYINKQCSLVSSVSYGVKLSTDVALGFLLIMQVSYHWFLLIVTALLLAVQPTFELFVRPSNADIEKDVGKTSEGSRKMSLDQDRLTYRPNERDKLSDSLSQAQKPSLAKKKLKPRQRRSSDLQRSSDSFVFPDQVSTLPSKKDKLNDRMFVVPNKAGPPPCAGGGTFCESVEEYPSEHVIRLLRKEPVFVRGFFQDDRKQLDNTDVQDRIDTQDENPLCVAQEQIVFPKMAKNIDGNWLFVINQDECIQGVRVEKCLHDGECSFPASLPNGYRSQCKQKYIYRKLVALNGTGQGVISDSFQFPSCCSCVIKQGGLSLASNRFGGGSGGGPMSPLPLTLLKTTPTPLKARP